MNTGRTLVFNHIPKTGGVTLRVILNRVYGEQDIFLIKSTDKGQDNLLTRYLSNTALQAKEQGRKTNSPGRKCVK